MSSPDKHLSSQLSLEEQRQDPFHSNKKTWKVVSEQLIQDRNKIALGGGEKSIARQHKKNRLFVRERIAKLIDKNTEFSELMTFAGHKMYQEAGGAVCGGTVTGIGLINGRQWMIIANDATVKAGAFFPITSKKVIRAQTIALENHLPTIYLVDSAGVYLPMQDEIFPDQDDFGRVFYLNARMSALGIPQMAAIMGNCVAGGAYLPVMCDTLIMTEGSGLYLAGPALVKAAIGQDVSSDDLGGAEMHASIAGTIDYHEKDDAAAISRLRSLASNYAQPEQSAWAKTRHETQEPKTKLTDLQGLLPTEGGTQSFDMHEVLARLLDNSDFDEFKASYGQTILCGTGRLGGFTVGIVANQKTIVKNKGKLEIGGVIYAEAADKAARFILNCNQTGIPIIFIHDVNGFMVGKDSEHEGIIRRGAKMVNAVSNSVVPRISLIVGGSYGAGHYAMSGKAFSPKFLFAWPSAKFSVMGGQQAAKTIMDIQLAQLKRQGKEPDDVELQALFEEISGDYEEALNIRYGAARLWLDEIILPTETRQRLIEALEVCALNPKQEELKLGVFQV